MKKAIYKPTNQNTIVLNEFDDYCEILLDGDYKTVSKNDIGFLDEIKILSFDELKRNIFINCVNKPLNDILYSYNTNRLTPETHQYKPLIKFLNSENNRVLIADEVGLGKTIEAGMIFKEIDKREELKVSLIVVPSSLTLKWKEELEIRFEEYFTIKKTNEFLNFLDEYDSYHSSKLMNEKIIISYHTLRDEKVIKKLKNSFFEVDFLIMDEAHTMRNYGTTTYESAELITSISEHIIFLSATPVQNSLTDLFNILHLLDEDYFKDFDYFEKMISPNFLIHKVIAYLRNNYALSDIKSLINENYKNDFSTSLNSIFNDLLELNNIDNLQKVNFINKLIECDYLSFVINRTKKKDVGRSIPRSAKSAIINLNAAEQNYYNSVIEFVKFLNPSTPQGFITIMPERMASSSMIASLESFKEVKKSGKLFIKDIDDLEDYYEDIDLRKEAIKYLDDIIEKGDLIGSYDSKFLKFEEILKDIKSQNIKQMIVFSFFKKTLDYLEIKLIELGYSVGKIHGDFSIEERFSKIKEFKKGSFDILLSSEVGSEGLDMQFCNVVINYDLPWNPMRVEQRIGRIDRIGQKFEKLHIFNLCISGSIEDRIYNRLYTKLNIFEQSIGELEPILGNLEEKLNISELIHLSQEEIDKKIHLQELAIKKQEIEVKEQNSQVDKLLNEDVNYEQKENNFLNQNKTTLLQNESKKIFIKYLEENQINFLELKDGNIKLSSENFKSFFNNLKSSMSERNTLKYKEERRILQKMIKYKELKISFSTNNNDEYQTLYLYLNHPIIMMMLANKTHSTVYTKIENLNYQNMYGIIYRVDIKALKSKSIIKTVILNKDLEYIEELDYFEFIKDCIPADDLKNSNLEDVKNKSISIVAKNIESLKDKENQAQSRLINIKIDSINSYFEKQINKVKKLEQKVLQEDVKRMRIGEIENLKNQKEKKIEELENQKEIQSSFEILGVVEIK